MYQARFIRIFSVIALALAFIGFPMAPALAGGSFIVTSVNEGADANPGDGFCKTAGNVCTLRAALQEANAHAGADTITFNLSGSGIHSISITSGPLPNITDTVTLDGTSQPNCTAPCIVLSGAALGSYDGLTLQSSNNIVKGFIITSWGNSGIYVLSGSGNIIQHNDIGFWPGNPTPLGNGQGIYVNTTAASTLIGGTTTAARNVISGNNGSGIVLNGGGTTIQGNFIGTNAAGTAALANSADGISLYSKATGNKIGGVVAGAGNRIAYNLGAGIALNDSTTHPVRNNIRRNSIFSNGGLGIDLNSNGVTLNDPLDPDAGANGLQNFPALTSATSSTRVIVGKLYSKTNITYAVEFFSSPTCDASHYGEGKTYLGSGSVLTNINGVGNFSITVTGNFAVGSFITATATDPNGNTSEFSACRAAN